MRLASRARLPRLEILRERVERSIDCSCMVFGEYLEPAQQIFYRLERSNLPYTLTAEILLPPRSILLRYRDELRTRHPLHGQEITLRQVARTMLGCQIVQHAGAVPEDESVHNLEHDCPGAFRESLRGSELEETERPGAP